MLVGRGEDAAAEEEERGEGWGIHGLGEWDGWGEMGRWKLWRLGEEERGGSSVMDVAGAFQRVRMYVDRVTGCEADCGNRT